MTKSEKQRLIFEEAEFERIAKEMEEENLRLYGKTIAPDDGSMQAIFMKEPPHLKKPKG